MKTAVEYIELRLLGIASFDSEELRLRYKDIIKEAKEIEKEHIINAYAEGGEDILLDRSEHNIDFFGNCHKYYNQTYKQNK